MKKMWIGIGVASLLAYVVISTLFVAGTFKKLDFHSQLEQTARYSIPGPEDMDLDDLHGRLFISSTDRRKYLQGRKTDDGIYILDIRNEPMPKKLMTTYAGEFHPHGISYFHDSLDYLFVINHNEAGSSVEVFEYQRDTLFHKNSFRHRDLFSPNDVVAVAAGKFYVTQDHGTRKGLMRTFEDYLRIPLSDLFYFDGNSFSKAYGGMNYANGVNVSPDGTQIYVSTTTGRSLLTFAREVESGKLILSNKTNLKTGLDNVDVDQEGNLWIAAHPQLLAFVSHANDSTQDSPSQVLKLKPNSTGGYDFQEIYLNDGKEISGCSVAVFYADELFMGCVFESKVMRMKFK